nr:threonine--tRNA ligase [Burkholderiales bacterium]
IPVMLHRAVLGSMERFIGILLENYAGALPFWLAPVQVMVLNISEAQNDYARGVTAELRAAGLRADCDLRNEKINYKIREHSLQKLPYQLIVGDKEVAARKVSVRARANADLGQMSLPDLISRFQSEIEHKGCAAV